MQLRIAIIALVLAFASNAMASPYIPALGVGQDASVAAQGQRLEME